MFRAATAASGGTGAPDCDVLLDLTLHGSDQRLHLDARGLLVLEQLDRGMQVGSVG